VFRAGMRAYDIQAVSRLLGEAQAAERPVANLASYHGQFQYYGRLSRPVVELTVQQAPAWSQRHPDGMLVAYYRDSMKELPGALHFQPYRGGSLAVWTGAMVAARPDVLP